MLYKNFHYTCRGAKHIENGSLCQDYSTSQYYKNGFAIAAVSDGHGGERYFRSQTGAQIACNVSRKIIQIFFKNMKKDDMDSDALNYKIFFRQLATSILKEWRKCVKDHFKSNELTETEIPIYNKHYHTQKNIYKIYGATFALAVMSDEISFVIQTGDSPCLIFKNDYNCHIPPKTINPDCTMGFTTSLSDSDAINNFRYYWSKEKPKAIFVCSDGIKDSYTEEDFLKFGAILLKEFEKNHKKAMIFVRDWLPKLSERGSGDDMSIAGIYQAIEDLAVIKENKAEG